ncbi:MAG: hypothetical protein JXR40_01310, partial [Pontiellaceae bacterium]|nr:hypothetical protein [Pontiellaceae bacterium]
RDRRGKVHSGAGRMRVKEKTGQFDLQSTMSAGVKIFLKRRLICNGSYGVIRALFHKLEEKFFVRA